MIFSPFIGIRKGGPLKGPQSWQMLIFMIIFLLSFPN